MVKKPLSKPRSLSGLVKQLRTQPNPRQRIVDIIAYAAVKQAHRTQKYPLNAQERNASRRDRAKAYNAALAEAKELAEMLADPDVSVKKKQSLDDKRHASMEKLLKAKIALTLDMLDVPATGDPESDIFAIGMQCIGDVDNRITNAPGPKTLNDNKIAQSVAVAQFLDLVLYDIKTEEILKGRHPDMQSTDNDVKDPILAIADIYQSLFEIRMHGKKPRYHVKANVFKNEQDADRFVKNLEWIEAKINLMSKRPETIKAEVEAGRIWLDNKVRPGKSTQKGAFFRLPSAQTKPSKSKKPWL